MIGAVGGVGGSVAVGLAALAAKRTPTTGLVTALPPFAKLNLIDPARIVVGGHEVRSQSLLETVEALHDQSRVLSREVISHAKRSLRSIQNEIRPGIAFGVSKSVRQLCQRACVRSVSTAMRAADGVRDDLISFRDRHQLKHVVVVNLASAEPPFRPQAAHKDCGRLIRAMKQRGQQVLPASSIYALGAFMADCSYINFTPSLGVRVPAIIQFAEQREALYMGRDGKTGETLLKSVLAPMFATRNLTVRNWIGHNVLGNRDGENLQDPRVRRMKTASKNQALPAILGYVPDAHTSIEYVRSLGDWKVAWDLIQFQGFLGTHMNLQFVWTGCDSLLAAPLVIDLVRLTAWSFSTGHRGRMDHLACFFKDPDGVAEFSYAQQWQRLLEHVARDT